MARNGSISPAEPNVNGRTAGTGDAVEPATVSDHDLGFEPAALGAAAPPAGPDPFDPAALRLDGGLAAAQGVKKVLVSVPVRKPEKSWFVRAHPDESYRVQTGVVELKEDRELFLVDKKLWPGLVGEATFRPKMLVTAINRQGVLFLWELNLPRRDGKVDEWTRTALEAVQMARDNWVRVTANMSLDPGTVKEKPRKAAFSRFA